MEERYRPMSELLPESDAELPPKEEPAPRNERASSAYTREQLVHAQESVDSVAHMTWASSVDRLAHRIGSLNERELTRLRSAVNGGPLVDLGSGNVGEELARFLNRPPSERTLQRAPSVIQGAQRMGIQTYIAVDKFFIDFHESGTRQSLSQSSEAVALPDIVLERCDMLEYVFELPGDFGSFLVSGIDQAILRPRDYTVDFWPVESEKATPDLYKEMLVNELFRATRPGGIVIVITCSDYLDPKSMQDVGFSYILPGNPPPGYRSNTPRIGSSLVFWQKPS